MKQHGGHVRVEIAVGRGTTVSLYFPAHPVPESQADAPLGGSPDLALGDGETILVVEDDAAMRAALVDALEVLNYHVLSAANGLEALKIFENQTKTFEFSEEFESQGIALVLSDWSMPGMSGLELVHQLSQRHDAVRALILTGHQQFPFWDCSTYPHCT